MSELRYWVWLSTLQGLPRRMAIDMLEYFGSPENVYFAGESDYRHVSRGDISPLLNKNIGTARRVIAQCEKLRLNIITLADGIYPTRLKNIYDPPTVLYVRGRMPAVDEEVAVAVVGTRRCTQYGHTAAERLGYEIACSGGLVITGLAKGIDAAAASGALRGNGKVIGVLGCGIDVVYPASSAPLYDAVAEDGALVSEYPPGTPPDKRNFPARNRIMSGLALGVAVVEAPERSGALITASLALEQGRDVFVVPGNVDSPACRGSNALLREGAAAVLSGWDVTENYAALFPHKILDRDSSARRDGPMPGSPFSQWETQPRDMKNPAEKEAKEGAKRQKATKKVFDNDDDGAYIDIIVKPEDVTAEELAVLRALNGPLHVDEIIERAGLPAAQVLSALTMLEISGAVIQDAGKIFNPRFRLQESEEQETGR